MAYWSRQIGAAPTLRLALVQADPTYLATFETLKRLSDSIDRPVDLVCWPESSGGSYEESLKNLSDADEVFRRSRDPNRGVRPWPHPRCELLLGAKLYRGDPERPDCIRQSAILLDRGENIVAAYHKRRLMPFGEYVPGEDLFPWINALFSVQDEVTPGEEANVLQTAGGVRLGVGLCYEDMDPGAAASLTRNGAELLISLINASAFETPLTLRQHRLLAQQRAIECRRCLARCAATGETCVISPLGAVDASLPTGKEGMLIAPVKLLSSQPWGCRWPGLTPGACGALLAACAWRRARSRSGSHSAS